MNANDSAADVLRNDYKLKVSEEGARCAELLRVWLGGLHHFPGGDKALRATDWSTFFVEVRLKHKTLCTFDGDSLTRLVFLAHDHAIRVDVFSDAMKSIAVMLHPRPRDGGGSCRDIRRSKRRSRRIVGSTRRPCDERIPEHRPRSG